jgi:hypothetical protein
MGYYVRLEIGWDGAGDDPYSKAAQKKILANVEEYLRKEQAEGRDGRLDWLDEFRQAFAGGRADIKLLDQVWVANLLMYVSARFPVTGFWARGVGEEFTDVWVLEVADGEVQWARNMNEERPGVPRVMDPRPPWPDPKDIDEVITESDIAESVREALAAQAPTAEVGALVLKRRGDRRPRSLVYIGPLGWEGYQQVKQLVEPTYRTQRYRDSRSLLSYPVATAKKPRS